MRDFLEEVCDFTQPAPFPDHHRRQDAFVQQRWAAPAVDYYVRRVAEAPMHWGRDRDRTADLVASLQQPMASPGPNANTPVPVGFTPATWQALLEETDKSYVVDVADLWLDVHKTRLAWQTELTELEDADPDTTNDGDTALRGDLLLRLRRYAEAEACLRPVHQRRPTAALVLYLLGRTLLAQDKEGAIPLLQECMESDESYREETFAILYDHLRRQGKESAAQDLARWNSSLCN